MTPVRQFRPALYALVLLGITGFALATGRAGLWAMAVLLIGLNAWLTRAGRLRPVPRLLANAVTLAVGGWATLAVLDGTVPVEPIGVFLVVVQIVKLYEQRGNRDYGQIVVLSLLTTVAAAMTGGGATLGFGLLLVGWLGLALYVGLLFHLKIEADAASARGRAGGGDDRAAGRGLRRTAAGVALAAAACGVVVFVLFPRGEGTAFLGRPMLDPKDAIVGFDDQVNLSDIAAIQTDDTPQAYVSVERDGRPLRSGMLYLRGTTLDVYSNDPDAGDRWTWRRSRAGERLTQELRLDAGLVTPLPADAPPPVRPPLVQRIDLEPTGTRALFALAGPVAIRADDASAQGVHDGRVRWSPPDGTLRAGGRPLMRRARYTVWSTGEIETGFGPEGGALDPDPGRRRMTGADWPGEALAVYRDRAEAMRLLTLHHARTGRRLTGGQAEAHVAARLGSTADAEAARRQDAAAGRRDRRDYGGNRQDAVDRPDPPPAPASPRVIEFALDPDVSGRDAQGRPLAPRRLRAAGTTRDDARIAANIAGHLRREFGYSLDVADDLAAEGGDRDPLGWFVAEGRRGHCELFAGAMAQACQTLGIPARVVVGFKSDEFNPSIDGFTVRRSDAHAWVEVLTHTGWRRHDPTSARDADGAGGGRLAGIGRRVRQWKDYLQFAWARHVVGYDRGRQAGVGEAGRSFVADLNASMDQAVVEDGGPGGWLRRNTLGRLEAVSRRLEALNLHAGGATAITALLVVLPLAAVVLIAAYLIGKWRLARRARRIGLDDLPPGEARRLARQLGFYDDLVRRLDRAGVRRPPGRTPREFARGLAFLPPAAYDAAARLTEAFYRVRYGRFPLPDTDRRALDADLDAVANGIAGQ